MPDLAGDRFDTKADAVVGPFVGKIPGHEAANLRDHVAAALREEQANTAAAIKKFAPDLAEELVRRYREATNALDDFLAIIRTEEK
jgi:hypothetical protein